MTSKQLDITIEEKFEEIDLASIFCSKADKKKVATYKRLKKQREDEGTEPLS